MLFQNTEKIAGKWLSDNIIKELCENGRTKILDGFISKKGNKFKTALVLSGEQIVFEYADNNLKCKDQDTIHIRVESASPGNVFISATGPCQYTCAVDFGLVPSRLAECLGIISIAKYLLFYHFNKKLIISANNKEFVQYALREITPSRKEARNLIEIMWHELGKFPSWEIRYNHIRKSLLHGGVTKGTFPRGLFPWLHADVDITNGQAVISLPKCPEVQYQFEASIRAQRKDNLLIVPEASCKVVNAWLATVKAKN